MSEAAQAEILAVLMKIHRSMESQKLARKRVLTVEEAAEYLGLSPSYIHKLSSKGEIPCSKPNGKTLFFDRLLLEEWLLRNPKAMKEDIAQKAADFNFKKK